MLERLRSISPAAWRDAGRLGAQSAAAAALAFLAAGAAGLDDEFLVIMMAVTSLQSSIGATLGQAVLRLESAAAGSLLGLLCLLLLPAGWGTAVALAAALALVGAASALRPAWALGVVPAVGMSLGERGTLAETAVTTSAGIALGAVIGVLVSFLVWPDRAEARFERHFRQALRAVAARLSDAIEATVEPGRTPRVPEHVNAWNEATWLAAEALGAARFVDREAMGRRLDALRELHASVVILDRAAEAADPPLSVEVMRDRVGRLRRDAVDVLLAMAEGRRGADRKIGAIDATLRRLREAMGDEDPHAPEHDVHSAVAFGLREVRRTLADLIAAQDAAAQPA